MMPRGARFLNRVRELIEPLLDGPPPDLSEGQWAERRRTLATIKTLVGESTVSAWHGWRGSA